MNNGFSQEVITAVPGLIEDRRWLHRHAEISFKEFRTTAWLAEQLSGLDGVTVERPTETGLVAHVYGTRPGEKHILGIRADIDALPMPEEAPVPFASETPGVMHACGHDGHAAILLSAVRLLSRSRESFCGEVRCFFQHAEELPPGGAIEMVRAGANAGVEVMLSLHLSSNYPTGMLGMRSGVLTSNVDKYEIAVRGKGGHCAFPEQCRDPITAACELIMQLQTIVSRRLPAKEPAVISVCAINGGTAYNIIPDEVNVKVSVRSFGEEARTRIETEIRRIAAGVAEGNSVSCTIDYEKGYPSVINDPVLTATVRALMIKRFGEAHLLELDPLMPGEDFSYFLSDEVPGFFLELGSGNAEKGCAFPHHNTRYCLDEEALGYGLQYELDTVRALLDGSGRFKERV